MKTVNSEKVLEALKNGYFGTAAYDDEIGDYSLCHTEIADPYDNECGWECAEWYLVDDDDDETLIARCNGYEGIEWMQNDDQLLELLKDEDTVDELKDKVQPYTITGDLIAGARAAMFEDAEDGYEGECKIWVMYNYYQSTLGAPVNAVMAADNNDELLFGSQAEAAAYLEPDDDDDTYYLSHGEAVRPSYRIVKA